MQSQFLQFMNNQQEQLRKDAVANDRANALMYQIGRDRKADARNAIIDKRATKVFEQNQAEVLKRNAINKATSDAYLLLGRDGRTSIRDKAISPNEQSYETAPLEGPLPKEAMPIYEANKGRITSDALTNRRTKALELLISAGASQLEANKAVSDTIDSFILARKKFEIEKFKAFNQKGGNNITINGVNGAGGSSKRANPYTSTRSDFNLDVNKRYEEVQKMLNRDNFSIASITGKLGDYVRKSVFGGDISAADTVAVNKAIYRANELRKEANKPPLTPEMAAAAIGGIIDGRNVFLANDFNTKTVEQLAHKIELATNKLGITNEVSSTNKKYDQNGTDINNINAIKTAQANELNKRLATLDALVGTRDKVGFTSLGTKTDSKSKIGNGSSQVSYINNPVYKAFKGPVGDGALLELASNNPAEYKKAISQLPESVQVKVSQALLKSYDSQNKDANESYKAPIRNKSVIAKSSSNNDALQVEYTNLISKRDNVNKYKNDAKRALRDLQEVAKSVQGMTQEEANKVLAPYRKTYAEAQSKTVFSPRDERRLQYLSESINPKKVSNITAKKAFEEASRKVIERKSTDGYFDFANLISNITSDGGQTYYGKDTLHYNNAVKANDKKVIEKAKIYGNELDTQITELMNKVGAPGSVKAQISTAYKTRSELVNRLSRTSEPSARSTLISSIKSTDKRLRELSTKSKSSDKLDKLIEERKKIRPYIQGMKSVGSKQSYDAVNAVDTERYGPMHTRIDKNGNTIRSRSKSAGQILRQMATAGAKVGMSIGGPEALLVRAGQKAGVKFGTEIIGNIDKIANTAKYTRNPIALSASVSEFNNAIKPAVVDTIKQSIK